MTTSAITDGEDTNCLPFSEHQPRLTTRAELNNAVQPLLTDLYQLSMAYAYWKTQNSDRAVFDLFFRRNPFHGEFTIFAGLEECLKYIQDFHFSDSGLFVFSSFIILCHFQVIQTRALIQQTNRY